jgi:gamma-glutamyl phosphate reductase
MIGHTKHRTKKQALATLATQNTEQKKQALATLATQNTEQKNKTQHRNINRRATWTPP